MRDLCRPHVFTSCAEGGPGQPEEEHAASIREHPCADLSDLHKTAHLPIERHTEQAALPPPYQLFLLFWLVAIVDVQFEFLLSFPETRPQCDAACVPNKRKPAAFPQFHLQSTHEIPPGFLKLSCKFPYLCNCQFPMKGRSLKGEKYTGTLLRSLRKSVPGFEFRAVSPGRPYSSAGALVLVC